VTTVTTEREGAAALNITLSVNGEERSTDVEPRRLLVHHLRDDLGLTGTNVGCDTSSCGACTVLMDGESVKSCTVLAVQADGHEITTIEGLAATAPARAVVGAGDAARAAVGAGDASGNGDPGALHPVQQAFHEQHGLQCGFCTPGMVMAAVSLLAENPHPTEADVRLGLEGNLCRCTGYHNIVRSVLAAAGELPASEEVPA
jgi:aerobic carbon-monoxide dehydrogenase small subunit